MNSFFGGLKELWCMAFRRCHLCHAHLRAVPLLRVQNPAGYYGEFYLYHQDCLTAVLADPEQYGHRTVDLALDIVEAEHTHRRELEKREKARTTRLETARKELGLDG